MIVCRTVLSDRLSQCIVRAKAHKLVMFATGCLLLLPVAPGGGAHRRQQTSAAMD